jgi:GNAT superfamily N-acetyltransferase
MMGIDVMACCHRNFATFYQMIAAEHGIAAERDGIAVAATPFPVPWLNLAVVQRPPADPDATLSWVASTFAQYAVPWLIYAADGVAPILESAAARQGLSPDHAEPGMLLSPLPEGNEPTPPGLEIRQVDDARSLADYQGVFAEAYEAPAGLSTCAFSAAVAARPGHALYVGYHEDRPVSITNRVSGQGMAGIYAVGTIPSHRSRGFGAAMVKRAAAEGRAEGCTASCLQSWEMGVGVYRGIGYRTVITYRTWSGPAN